MRALTTLKTALPSSRKSCTKKWAKTRPLVFCRRAASEGKISSTPVMRLQWKRLKQKRKSSAVRGERQLPASSSANTSANTASTAMLVFRVIMPPPPFRSLLFIVLYIIIRRHEKQSAARRPSQGQNPLWLCAENHRRSFVAPLLRMTCARRGLRVGEKML